jgi:uncharacterized protein YjeT (DUF2065 family)
MQYSVIQLMLIALAMVLIIEGLGPMLFTKKWRLFLQLVSEQPSSQLRTLGGILVTVGVVILYYLLW